MVDATPASSFSMTPVQNAIDGIKAAGPQLIIDNGVVSEEAQYILVFEDISSKELINITRTDTVNGQKVAYSPIKNLASLGVKYGPQTLVPISGTSRTYFDNFPIKLERKIPDTGTGPLGEVVYIDPITKDLIVNVFNLLDDEFVEVEILSRGAVLNDTIYTEGSN
jgi:hypothetical protein